MYINKSTFKDDNTSNRNISHQQFESLNINTMYKTISQRLFSLYHSSTDIMAMERPIALTSSDIAALDINPGTKITIFILFLFRLILFRHYLIYYYQYYFFFHMNIFIFFFLIVN